MKRIIIYFLIIASVFVVPVKWADIGKLQPIEVVLLDAVQDEIFLYTDTKDTGRGESIGKAIADMKENSERIVYLDTAQYVLTTERAVDHLLELEPYLATSVRIGMVKETIDLQWAASYLQIHRNYPNYTQWKRGDNIPELVCEKNFEKSKNSA